MQWRLSYSQIFTSCLTTFSMKNNWLAVDKYFLFIQNIFSSQLKIQLSFTEFIHHAKVVRKGVKIEWTLLYS